MHIDNIVDSIINLPIKFRAVQNMSIYSLLKETGYFENHEQINEDDIIKALNNHPECINQWLIWSEDKRSSSGWYFKKNENKKYVVGYFPAKKDLNQIKYSNIEKACAAFIKREIEDIRKS